jgi:hypothetical protein
VYEADSDEAGTFVKQLIESLTSPNRQSQKRLYQTVLLPATHLKLKDLVVARPLTLKGRPGTTLEITQGSILVDFELGQDLTGTMEKVNQVFIICECEIVYGDRTNFVIIKDELERDEMT